MSYLRSYLLMMRWNALRLRALLPLFAVIQAGLAAGVIIGFAYLMPQVDPATAMFLSTGGVTIGLITVGLVVAPQIVAQSKLQGTFGFDRTLPVHPLAALGADVTPWILGTLPGIVLSLLLASARFHLRFRISPLVAPAVLLVALTATALGYGLAHALTPTAVSLASQLLVVFTLMFSPVNFPSDRLPAWLQTVHTVLPIQYMAQAIRETLNVPPRGVSWTPFIVLASWCLAGLAITYRAMTRRL
jgi:ABC-2 type transport system permease protein